MSRRFFSRASLSRSLGATLLLATSNGCGGSNAALAPTAEGRRAEATNDPLAARAAYDRGLKLRLAGDELGATKAMSALAHEHPGTAHGRAAAQQAGAGLIVLMAMAGMSAAAMIPIFLRASSGEEPTGGEPPAGDAL